MDKCCDNCKYDAKEARESKRNTHYLCRELGEQLWRENWHTSKDYCSKWEEKEEQTTLKDIKDILKSNRTANQKSCVVEHYFKQRIEESLEKIGHNELLGHMVKNPHGSFVMSEIESEFKWILD